MRRIIATGILLICIGGLAFSQAGEQKVALVIGNSEYAESPLRNPANDATDVGRRLATLGFNVSVLTNATHEEMEEAAYLFGSRLSSGGVGFFYYAGHGAQYNGENYLIPVDAKIRSAAELRYKALSAGLILSYMTDARNRLNMIILDACRDNPFAGARSAARGLAVVDQLPTGSVIVYATAPGKTAQDGTGRNSPFTEAFLEHVDTAGLGVKEMFDLVGRDVSDTTLGQQRPWISHDFYDEFEFTPESATDTPSPTPSRDTVGETPKTDGSPTGPQQYGELFIVTEPDDARISVNGEDKGESPLFLPQVPLQTALTITATKEGWSGSSEVTLTKSELVDISITLKAEEGNLIITSTEKDVDVYFDGDLLGPFGSGLFRDLPAGDHRVELKGSGLYWQSDVAIQANQTTQLQAQPQTVETGMEGVTRIEFRGDEVSEQITPAGDEDWYLVDIGGIESQYLFTASTTGATDTYIEIYGPNDREILVGQNDDGEDQNAVATILASHGERYWVKVRGYSSDTTGEYVLHTSAESYIGDMLEPNDSRDASIALRIEGPPIETTIIPAEDIDWFSIQLAREADYDAYLTIETTGDRDTVMRLYYGDEEIAYNDDGGDESNAKIYYRPEQTGTYYVEVWGYGDSELGAYEIKAYWTQAYPDRYEPDDVREDALSMQLNGERHAFNFIPGDDIDWVRLDLREQQGLDISSFGDADTYFRLYDQNDNVIIEDDDSGTAYNASIKITLDPGTYYLRINQLDESLFGTQYEIAVSAGGDYEEAPVVGETIEVDPNGRFIEASLRTSGQEDWYTFIVPDEDPLYMISASTTGGTDTYIELYGPGNRNTLLTENDDGSDSNAVVTVAAERGDRYWVKVRGYGSDTLGDYQFHLRADPAGDDPLEPNNTPGEATSLRIDGPSVASSIMPGTDVDWFALRVSSIPSDDSFLTIQTFSEMDTYLELYYGDELVTEDDDGGMDANARIFYQPERTGTYFVLARSYDESNVGPFEIMAEWVQVSPDAYEPDDEPGDAARISMDGEPQTHNFVPGDDNDWLRINVRDAGIIEFRTFGDADTYFMLYDDNDNLIAEDDDGGENYNALLNLNLESGVYYLNITQVSSDLPGTEYQVAVMPGGMSQDTESKIIEIWDNYVYEEGQLTREGQQDWYTFRVDGAEVERVLQVFTAGTTDTYIELYGPNSPSELVTENDDGSDSNAHVSAVVPPGALYWVKVRGYDSSTTGDYRLHIVSTELELDIYEPNDSLEEAKPIRIGDIIDASLIPGSDVDWYKITVERVPTTRTGSPYYLAVETDSDMDTIIDMYSDDDEFYASNDDGGIDSNAKVILPVEHAGNYYAEVRHYDGSGLGPYGLRAVWIEGNPDEFEPDSQRREATRYDVGSDPQWRNFSPGHDADWISFTIRSRENIQITTFGSSDTYAVLYTGDEVIAEDDDGGDNYNCLIQETLDPGTYYVEITQIDEIFEAEYELSIVYGFPMERSGGNGY